MSLITRCPACETLFRVVPDQLRVSQGWVRCGQCDAIFDASLHLLPDPAKEAAPDVQHDPVAPGLDATVLVDSAAESIGVDPHSDRPISAVELPTEQELLLSAMTRNRAVQLDASPSAPTDSPDLQLEVTRSAPEPATPPGQGDDNDLKEHEQEGNADISDASFLRNRNPDRFWKRTIVRTALGILSFSLLLLLSGQIVFHELDRIVASQPKARPWVLAYCEFLHCTLSALRQIESITIESSSFVKIGTNAYRLNLTLKSASDAPLAIPAIEMTLTDSSDQPVIRRVILPADLDVKSNTLAARSEWPASLTLAVKAPAQPNPITGYRLLAFYP